MSKQNPDQFGKKRNVRTLHVCEGRPILPATATGISARLHLVAYQTVWRDRIGLSRRTISQTATKPISQAMLVRPMRVTIAAVKLEAPPSNGVTANRVSS